jgi:2,3-bisphosphoglycerate-dependent phosphoglycerate mutase
MSNDRERLHIYIFRHGQTYFNRDKRFTGWKNSNLTPKGVEQARKVSEKLKDKKFEVAFRTRLSRTLETLKIVLKHHPECEKVVVDDRMIERSYGKFERKYHKTIIKRYGKEQFDVWHRSYDIQPPDGESIRMVEVRVLSFIKDLISLMKRKKINVAITAHGNSMRPFRRYFENLSIEQMMRLENPYDDFFEYVIEI